MLFGLYCIVIAVGAVVVIEVRSLKRQVKRMASAQEQTTADLDALGAKLNAWLEAGAAAKQAELDKMKAAWDAKNEADWTAAHVKLTNLIAAVPAGEPITPPATPANPNPEPVPAPAIVTPAPAGAIS